MRDQAAAVNRWLCSHSEKLLLGWQSPARQQDRSTQSAGGGDGDKGLELEGSVIVPEAESPELSLGGERGLVLVL